MDKITEVHEVLNFLSTQPQLRKIYNRDDNGTLIEIQIGLTESLQLIIGPFLGIHDRQLAGRDDTKE